MRPRSLAYVLFLCFLPMCGDRQEAACHDHSVACFSPTADPSLLYDPCVLGCVCDPSADREVCVGARVLTCRSSRWEIMEGVLCDGPGDAGTDAPVSSVDAAIDAPALSVDVAVDASMGLGTDGPVAETMDLCFSPTSNTALMYDPKVLGCVCDPGADKEVCVGARVLTCRSGRWEMMKGTFCEAFPDAAVDAFATEVR